MTWIARLHKRHALDTHYYAGLESICKAARLDDKDDVTFAPRIKLDSSWCDICQKMLKTTSTHNRVNLIKTKLELCQKRLERGLDAEIRLQDMVLNYLRHNDTKLPVAMSELKDVFSDDCPKDVFEYLLIPLIISGKISVHKTAVSPIILAYEKEEGEKGKIAC